MQPKDYTYWLVSLPVHYNDEDVLRAKIADVLSQKIIATDVAEIFEVGLPEFRVGTLDSLVLANEEMHRAETTCKAIVDSILTMIRDVLNDKSGHAPIDTASFLSNILVNEMPPRQYLEEFQWNHMKYRIDITVREIGQLLYKEATDIESLVKGRMKRYQEAASEYKKIEQRASGPLMNVDIAFIVQPEDFLSTDFLETLFFVVPKEKQSAWLKEYTEFAEMVLPDSAKQIATDGSTYLYGVAIMRAKSKDFITTAIKHGYIHKPYEPNSEVFSNRDRVASEKSTQWSSILRLLKTNYGEIFSIWVHVKMSRLFVESVLRYGLPPVFEFFVIRPLKTEKKLREVFLKCLEVLNLEDVNQLELTAAIKAHSRNLSQQELESSAEEAEMWQTLHQSNLSGETCVCGDRFYDPFVNLEMIIRCF